jgi:hypothetical protein
MEYAPTINPAYDQQTPQRHGTVYMPAMGPSGDAYRYSSLPPYGPGDGVSTMHWPISPNAGVYTEHKPAHEMLSPVRSLAPAQVSPMSR